MHGFSGKDFGDKAHGADDTLLTCAAARQECAACTYPAVGANDHAFCFARKSLTHRVVVKLTRIGMRQDDDPGRQRCPFADMDFATQVQQAVGADMGIVVNMQISEATDGVDDAYAVDAYVFPDTGTTQTQQQCTQSRLYYGMQDELVEDKASFDECFFHAVFARFLAKYIVHGSDDAIDISIRHS